VESFSRALLLLIAAALLFAYLNHGPAGVKGWLRAKFLGKRG
jgi:hypothetical protein